MGDDIKINGGEEPFQFESPTGFKPLNGPRIGTERFNYELLRHEVLLEGGWTPLPLGMKEHHRIAEWQYNKERRTIEPKFDPLAHRAAGGLTIYDIGLDESRPATQADLTEMQQALNKLCTERDDATRLNIMLRSERDAWKKFYDGEKADNTAMRVLLQPSVNREGELLAEITRLKDQLWLPREVGDHPYHGPTKPDPDTGRPVPVPDPVHERFHGSIGDVIAGNVMPEARRQMQEALKTAPKAPTVIPTTPSTDDPRRLGSEWLARLG